MKRKVELDLTYAPSINSIPEKYGDVYKVACSGDAITVTSWKDIWVKNYAATKDRFGSFEEKSYGQLFGLNAHKPMIVIGSGPSLKTCLPDLKRNKALLNPVKSISCLHNFGILEDENCHADYYLSLDSGGVVIDDVTEARNKDGNFYWDATKDKTLIAYAASDPRLFDLWQGKVYLFNCLIPDSELREKLNGIERFSHYVSSGGNAGGAAMYTAKAVMGSSEIIYVGMDFSFSMERNFHSYGTHYDNVGGKGIGNVVSWPSVFGNTAPWSVTWPSYLNFKFWMDWVSYNVPGTWSTASEGILGAYPEGNINSFNYGNLNFLLEKYRVAEEVDLGEFKIENGVRKVSVNEDGSPKKKPIYLTELFKDTKQPLDITLF